MVHNYGLAASLLSKDEKVDSKANGKVGGLKILRTLYSIFA